MLIATCVTMAAFVAAAQDPLSERWGRVGASSIFQGARELLDRIRQR
jgi:hypothetical protein